jgi:hypothetical protein
MWWFDTLPQKATMNDLDWPRQAPLRALQRLPVREPPVGLVPEIDSFLASDPA